MLWLYATAFAVGVLIGTAGIGGILLIPALSAFAALTLHQAMATALFTFLFTGIAGTAAFHRHGSIDWKITAPVVAGALPFAFAGAWLNARMPSAVLALLLAGIILFAGVHALRSGRRRRSVVYDGCPRAQRALLCGLGTFVGLAAGLTGVGGPVLSVPLMMLAGFPVLACIGAGQVLQVAAAASGTLGNLQFGAIDFAVGLPVVVLEVGGVFAGARLAHAMNPLPLRRLVAVLCILVGIFLFARLLHAP